MRGRAARRAAPPIVFAALLITGCASVSRRGIAPSQRPSRDVESRVAEIASRFEANEFEAADSLARRLLAANPEFDQRDEVLYIASRSSHSLTEYSQTVKYAEELAAEYPLSPRLEESLIVRADAEGKLGRYFESAEALSLALERPLEPEVRERCAGDLRRLAEDKLGAAELEKLVAAHPTSPLVSEISFRLARKEYARGNYDRSYALLGELLSEFPNHPHAGEIRYLLEASESRMDGTEAEPVFVAPDKLGILLPYTGEYSRFGRDFEEGARLAIDEHNGSGGIPVSFVLGDTKADPITAVSAARRLIVEEGVVTVLGAVFTVPSIAAAVECNAKRVPMVAPLVKDGDLRNIGPWIFQMRIPVEIEATAVAELASGGLLLERLAILGPSTPEGERLAGLFKDEILRRGGDVVIVESFKPGDTDFREQLEAIRAKAPDGMFIPAGPDELVNILPQIRFYDLQIQLLGLSSWNSEKLLRLAGRELEGAVFPREGYFAKDAGAYERFAAGYLERHGTDGRSKGPEEVSPVAAAGYFGAMAFLRAIDGGAVDREQVRKFLESELVANGDELLKTVESLPLVTVSAGKIRDFARPERE